MTDTSVNPLGKPGEERCPDCGAPVPGGRAGCQAIWDNFSLQVTADLRLGGVRDLALDAYCLQHLGRYCRSAKSYAAHLTRLCCGLEYAANPTIYAAIRRWLDGRVDLVLPEPPQDLGQVTIASLVPSSTPEEYLAQVQVWAGNVWAAYSLQHDLARQWIQAALESPASLRKKSTNSKK